MAFFDEMVCNLSDAGLLTRSALRAVVVAYGTDDIKTDLDVRDDAKDKRGADVYFLVCRAAGVKVPRLPNRKLGDWGDSPKATAAWDAWFAAVDRAFWDALRKVAGSHREPC